MNEILSETKQRATVVNALFHKILENVGYPSRGQKDIVEQILPTEYYIGHEFVEINRMEVSQLVIINKEFAILTGFFFSCLFRTSTGWPTAPWCTPQWTTPTTESALSPHRTRVIFNG